VTTDNTHWAGTDIEWVEPCPTCRKSVVWRTREGKLLIDCVKCAKVKVPLYGVRD
jgi:hypothetical protein